MLISVEKDLCVGAGACVLSAGEVFDQDDDGIVVLLTERPEDADHAAVRDAVAACPAAALKIIED
ncbi:ferredoxin-1 [Streptomyces tateyamensis]|uniref:Ferredoxin n=1 Tax=Streptomyces tateyamensis TaxID=565073 RepID=A0A2V4P2Q3_9ACTN|nr:ferredoxin [Streptomyces tateyamensis]PYC78537.1 ferredoxin-1 [Streptomyces tateyamensis]